jgi:hypothetical protein
MTDINVETANLSRRVSERLHMTGHEVDLREMKRPKCKGCGANTTLVRRTPDPDHGARHELRTFMCFKCKRERTVSMKLSDKKTMRRAGRGP